MKKVLIPLFLFISVSVSAQYRALIEKDTTNLVATKTNLSAKADTSNVTQTADYVIEKVGITYYARPAFKSGFISYSASDITTVLNNAITAISSTGGKIVIGVSGSLSDELTITGVSGKQIIIEGKSKTITLTQNTSGKNLFVIKNGASVVLKNLTLNTGSAAKSAILADSTGSTTKMSWTNGKIDNVDILASSTGYAAVILRNFYYLAVPYVYIHSFNNSGLVLENTTSANNYGNSHFGDVISDCSSSSPFACLTIRRNGGGSLDHLVFDQLNLYDGYYGVWTDYCTYTDFGHIDFEYGSYPMHIGDGGGTSNFNSVRSALFTSTVTNYTGIYVGTQSYGNSFNNITFQGASTSIVPIQDLSINQEPNSYNNLMYDGADYSPNVSINQASSTPYSYKLSWPNAKTSTYLPAGTTTTTPATGDNSTALATTNFVNTANSDLHISGLQAMGSSIKATGMALPFLSLAFGTSTLVSGFPRWISVYLKKDATLTGIEVPLIASGVYTASNYNGVGLYSVSGGTATLVASSTNNGTVWQASPGLISVPFSSTYSATKGLYYVALFYSQSAQTTAPGIAVGQSFSSSIFSGMDFSNGNVLTGTSSDVTAPSTKTITALTKDVHTYFIALY